MQPWQPEEVPTVLAAPHVDPEIKRTALDSVPDEAVDIEDGGESVAPKGEVTGEGARPRTPAERLNLSGASRAKHQKCLANAIYFEARGEVERGQMAVAQVVLNRAFSGKYPDTVCGVVYQNKHRHFACQFSFACDNHREVIREPDMWDRAQKIAKASLDGQLWLPEVGKSTHYHAYWVRPSWVNEMRKMYKTGVHTSRTRASAAAFRAISGPIPAGSPTVIPITGFVPCIREHPAPGTGKWISSTAATSASAAAAGPAPAAGSGWIAAASAAAFVRAAAVLDAFAVRQLVAEAALQPSAHP